MLQCKLIAMKFSTFLVTLFPFEVNLDLNQILIVNSEFCSSLSEAI